ncbi:LysR substrate-binding domain-containing protein [Acidocella sp.]|uniref:LysR substrate-binding domain-containing protein n=1 Tax=Acidocella sp. TaxID=50710 RepID=UPI002610B6D2|nr:LysR substrate-binding domain-containing protein [Acidocella sp.]
MPASAPFNFRHLAAALAVARGGGISRAAQAMHLSQPALTQGLARLEATLGARLFVRSGQGTGLTPEGELFLPRIARAFEGLRAAERALPGAPALHRHASATQWRALAAMVEARSTAQAARALGMSQQSLHRALMGLEGLSATPLFTRTRQGLEPLPEARLLARAAGLAFAELRQGAWGLRELRGLMDGTITIGALPLARSALIPQAATALLARYPELRLQIIDGPYAELLHGLRHGHIDFIIGALRTPAPGPDIAQEEFFTEPLSIIVRPGHPALTAPPTAQSLARLGWVLPRQGTPARAIFTAFFTAAQVAPPTQVIECSSLVAARGLLLASDRAAIFSRSQVRFELATGQLAALAAPLPGSARPIGLSLRRDFTPTRAQQACLAALRLAAADLAGDSPGMLEKRPHQP